MLPLPPSGYGAGKLRKSPLTIATLVIHLVYKYKTFYLLATTIGFEPSSLRLKNQESNYVAIPQLNSTR